MQFPNVSFYLFSSWTIEVSLCPLITICCSFSCFATWMKMSNSVKPDCLTLTPTTTHSEGATTYIFSRGAWHFNPGFGEKGTRSKHKNNVDDCVDWVLQNRAEWLRRRKIVTESTYGISTGWTTWWCVLQTKEYKLLELFTKDYLTILESYFFLHF